MLTHRDNIMHPSCHIIFWFSMKFYTETIAMFNQLAPEMDINYAPLVWHKTDNKGIIRDINHTPRHIYETALFITRGDRKIIKAIGDAYGAPTRKSEALHISEKPVPVLRHFMQLCVDGYSEVLDPTAGSGSAVRAAHSLGAKRVLGLELNPTFADTAQSEFAKLVAIESLREATS
jgi:DNA modification methylase